MTSSVRRTKETQARNKQRGRERVECAMHAYQKHGKEAEELRKGIEDVIKSLRSAYGFCADCGGPEDMARAAAYDLENLLDSVDARDSLAYLERNPKRRKKT